MKYSPLFGSVLTFSLLVSGAVPALANDAVVDVSVTATAGTHVETEKSGDSREFPGSRFLQGVKDRVRGDGMRDS